MCTTYLGENHTMPRIQVTVKPSQYELLKRLAKLQHRSMSKVISELFDEIEPVYERVAVVLQAASRAQESANRGLVEAAEKTEAEMAPHVAAAMGQFDMLMQSFGTGASPGVLSGATVAGPAPTPEPVTRGSGLPNTHPLAKPSPPLKSRKFLRKPLVRGAQGRVKKAHVRKRRVGRS